MPDIRLPPKWRKVFQVCWVLAYLLAVGMGIASMLRFPRTTTAEIGIFATYVWSGSLTLGAVICLAGAVAVFWSARGFYVEWIGTALATAGMSGYAVAVWRTVFNADGSWGFGFAMAILTLAAFARFLRLVYWSSENLRVEIRQGMIHRRGTDG